MVMGSASQAQPEAPTRINLEALVHVIPIGIAASFVASVIYDSGFTNALGVNLFSLPMTLADYTEGAIQWLPPAMLGFLIGDAASTGTQTVVSAITPRSGIASKLVPRIAWGGSLAAIFVGAWWVAGDLLSGGLTGVVALVILGRLLKWSPGVVAALILMFFAYWSGFIRGATPAALLGQSATITSADGSHVTVPLLQALERGVLYLDADDQPAFVQWDAVQGISSVPKPTRLRYGHLCEVLRCPHASSRAP